MTSDVQTASNASTNGFEPNVKVINDAPIPMQKNQQKYTQPNQDYEINLEKVIAVTDNFTNASVPSQHQLSTSLMPPSPQNQNPSLNSSFNEDPGKLKQTGRRSGRFRKSTTGSNISYTGGQPQYSSPDSAENSHNQSTIMNSLIVDSLSRPTTPHVPRESVSTPINPSSDYRLKKSSSISRTESYRRARGTSGEDDQRGSGRRPQSQLPLPGPPTSNLRRGNSEDSLRAAMNNERAGPMPRSKSRQEKKGDCSIM